MSNSIAIVSEHASPLSALGGADSGGQNVYVAQIAKHLAARGHYVEVFTRKDAPDLPDVVQWEDGVRVVHVPAGPAKRIRKEGLLAYMSQFTDYMLDYCRRDKPFDVIHANFWMSGLVGMHLKRQLGIPLVVTFHALGKIRRQFQGKSDGFPDERFAIEAEVMREADRVIAECPQDLQDQVALYGCDRDKLCMIPCGFDPDEMWPIKKSVCRRKLGLAENAFIILQLGRMVERKGIDNVVRAVGRLRRAHAQDARLLIVGGESSLPDPEITPEIGRLQALAAEEHVTDLVTFVGQRKRDELRFYYGAADVFVTTPLYEPFGITPLEAMACGTPVVGSNVGGIKYTVVEGETGMLVPPDDSQALAERLAHLGRNPGLRRKLGQQAIRRMRFFTWQTVTESVASLYQEVIDEQPRKAVVPAGSSHSGELNGRRNGFHSAGASSRREDASRAVFLDKDGTLIHDVPYNVNPHLIKLTSGALQGLSELHLNGYRLIVVSNQSGVARGYFTEEALQPVHAELTRLLATRGIPLDGFFYCPHHPQGLVPRYRRRCLCRKPQPGLLVQAADRLGIDLHASWMIGDILDDVEAGRRAGCRTVLIDNGNETEWDASTDRIPNVLAADLAEAAERILSAGDVPMQPPLAPAIVGHESRVGMGEQV